MTAKKEEKPHAYHAPLRRAGCVAHLRSSSEAIAQKKGGAAAERKSYNSAFTLIEMMIVLLILAISATFFLSYKFAVETTAKRELTQQRMDDIRNALIAFRQFNHRLPCPADPTLNIGSASFGVERRTGNCDAAYVGGGTGGRDGAVPTKTLGISDDWMYDGWGRRFNYAVLYLMTRNCAFTDNPISTPISGFTVQDENANVRATDALFVLVSPGLNGHGGYLQSGSRYSADSTNTYEQNNCNCSSTAVASSTAPTLDMTFIEATSDLEDPTDPRNRFDDMITYANRANVRSVEEENGITETCP